jgi:hypothetical protein
MPRNSAWASSTRRLGVSRVARRRPKPHGRLGSGFYGLLFLMFTLVLPSLRGGEADLLEMVTAQLRLEARKSTNVWIRGGLLRCMDEQVLASRRRALFPDRSPAEADHSEMGWSQAKYSFELAIQDWGFACQRTRLGPDISTRWVRPCKEYWVRSNDFAMDVKYLNPTEAQRASGEAGSAEATLPFESTSPAFPGYPFLPQSVLDWLSSLKSVETQRTNDSFGRNLVVFRGSSKDEETEIHFSADASFLPVFTKTSTQGVLTIITAGKTRGNRQWHPDWVEMRVFSKSGTVWWTDSLTNTVVEAVDRKVLKRFLAELAIKQGTIVNDDRSTQRIAYVMGYRPPSEAEITAMRKSTQAIMNYVQETAVDPTLRKPNPAVWLPFQ